MKKLSFTGITTTVGLVLGLTGCATNTPGGSSFSVGGFTPPSGHVIGGSGYTGIAGASIQIWQAGKSGYSGSAAKALLASPVTTDAGGNFTLTGQAACDADTYLYITASGGMAGTSGGSNPQLALMSVLGPCVASESGTFITINEVTTVAAVYALAGFSQGSTFGTPLGASAAASSTTPVDNFSTSAKNSQGLGNAMAIAQVLAYPTIGASPGHNTNNSATVEYWQINTIANILAACVGSTGGVTGDGSSCGTLFANVPHTKGTPADTIQAALALALHPTVAPASVTALYGLIPASPAYTPYADAGSIVDFTIGVTYTPVIPGTKTAVMTNPNQIAFDSVGNAWISTLYSQGHPVVELDPTGNPIQAGSSGVYSVTNYLLSGTSTPIAGGGTSAIPAGLALDTADNAWVADMNGNALFRITGSGGIVGGANGGGATGSTPAVGYAIQSGGGPAGSKPAMVAIDGQNNVWFTQAGATTGVSGNCGSYTVGNKGIGAFLARAYGTYVQGGAGSFAPYGLAIDGGGSYDSTTSGKIPGAPFLWATYQNGGSGGPGTFYGAIGHYYTSGSSIGCSTPLSVIGPAAAKETVLVPAINPSGSDAINLSGQPIGVAIDHGGNVWIVNNNYVDVNSTIISSVSKLTPNYGSAFTVAQANANFTFQNFQVGTGGASNKYSPYYLAIDGSGDVWISGNSGSSTVGSGVVELNNAGTALSPPTGYFGSTYTATVGTTTTKNARVLSVNRGIAVDLSGNVWVTNDNVLSVTVIVGAATPVVTPLSMGVKNDTLGTAP